MLDHFDILAPVYDRLIGPPDPARLTALLRLPTDGWLLDAGGGTGRVAAGLRPFVGGLIIGVADSGDTAIGSQPVLGALLALAGAIAVAVYLVIGRSLRAKLPLLPYIWLVYSMAAVFLILLVVVTATPIVGFSAAGYFWIVVMALAPQLIGHTSFNYALRYIPATVVGIITQAEPVGAAIAAFFIFGQLPLPAQIIGSLLILGGVTLASLGQSQR